MSVVHPGGIATISCAPCAPASLCHQTMPGAPNMIEFFDEFAKTHGPGSRVGITRLERTGPCILIGSDYLRKLDRLQRILPRQHTSGY